MRIYDGIYKNTSLYCYVCQVLSSVNCLFIFDIYVLNIAEMIFPNDPRILNKLFHNFFRFYTCVVTGPWQYMRVNFNEM